MKFSFCFLQFLWRLLSTTSKHKNSKQAWEQTLFFKCTFKNTMQNKARNCLGHIKNKKSVCRAGLFRDKSRNFNNAPLQVLSPVWSVFQLLLGVCACASFSFSCWSFILPQLTSKCCRQFWTNNQLNKRMFSLWSWWQENGSQRKWFINLH